MRPLQDQAVPEAGTRLPSRTTKTTTDGWKGLVALDRTWSTPGMRIVQRWRNCFERYRSDVPIPVSFSSWDSRCLLAQISLSFSLSTPDMISYKPRILMHYWKWCTCRKEENEEKEFPAFRLTNDLWTFFRGTCKVFVGARFFWLVISYSNLACHLTAQPHPYPSQINSSD